MQWQKRQKTKGQTTIYIINAYECLIIHWTATTKYGKIILIILSNYTHVFSSI